MAIDAYAWANTVSKRIVSHDGDRLVNILREIHDTNQMLQNTNVVGFMYQATMFHVDGQQPTAGATKIVLHPTLMDRMVEFVEKRKKTQRDMDMIRQCLITLFHSCTTYQDIRDVIPDCVLQFVPEVQNLSRTREAAFNLKDNNPTAYKHYLKILPKMEMYSVAKLFY